MDASGSRTVLIDGYNVIKRHEPWRRLTLQDGRTRLLALVSGIRWPVPVRSTIVVFDGRGADAAAVHRTGAVEVRFASPSADACLQHAIRTSTHPDRLIVITDDGDILRTAKNHGARCHSSLWLLALGLKQRERAEPVGRPDDRSALPAAEARRITEELAKRWLGLEGFHRL